MTGLILYTTEGGCLGAAAVVKEPLTTAFEHWVLVPAATTEESSVVLITDKAARDSAGGAIVKNSWSVQTYPSFPILDAQRPELSWTHDPA